MMAEVQPNEDGVPDLNNPKIACEKCQTSFTRKSNLYKHMRRIHNKDINISRGKVCGICDKRVGTLPLLHTHITETHDVSLQFTEETFYCEEDFLKWKTEIEKEGQSSFNLVTNKNTEDEVVTVRCYLCHRSGLRVRTKQNSTRRKCASKKIGFTCPASIYVVAETVDGISYIKVKYQSVHVGHELGVKLRLSKEDKALLASSMNSGVSITNMLKELRENYDPSHRYHHVTRKDLYNISRDYKVSRICLLQREQFEKVDIVVRKIFKSDFQSALLAYKPVGETLPEYPDLDKNDFVLGFMNDVQEKLLELYGNSCIMIDYTDCKYFYLFTLMIRDEFNESLPVATLLSSRISAEVLHPFFDAIQLRLPEFETKIIMSDDVIYFHNVWQKVFEDNAQHFLCSRYVLRNLIRNVEIKVKSKNRKDMKNRLKAMLKEEDIATFESMTKTLIEKYEVEEDDFITYFKTNYEPRAKKWAYCYRIALGINPDMRLERWRNQLKLDEKGGVFKRLDETLSLVMSNVARKLLSNVIAMDAEKLSARISICQKLHEETVSKKDDFDIVNVNENKCTISEFENGKAFYFTIEKLKEDCACDIRCQKCNICIHSMSCTCVDSCVHFTICKHMHRFSGPFPPSDSRIITRSMGNCDSSSHGDNEPTCSMETDDDKSTEPSVYPQFIVDDVRRRMKEQFQILEKRLENIDQLEAMKKVTENLSSINSYLDDAIPSNTFSNKVPRP